MSAPNPNKQPVELNRTSLYWGSLTCMRAIGLTKPRGAVKAKSSLSARGTIRKAQSRDIQSTSHCWVYTDEFKHIIRRRKRK